MEKDNLMIIAAAVFLCLSIVLSSYQAYAYEPPCYSCGGEVGNQHCYHVNHGVMTCSLGWGGDCNNIGDECSNGDPYP